MDKDEVLIPQYLTTKEVAKYLDKEVPTIYSYVKKKKLTPVYEDKWQIDASLLFKKEDVEGLKKILEKPGITTGEAAARLGVHPSTVSSYISKGILPADRKYHEGLGRKVYFIEPEVLETFKASYLIHQKRNKHSYFLKDGGYHLFQSFVNPTTNELARLMEIDGNSGKVISESGRIFLLSDLEKEGFVPSQVVRDQDYITKRGYAKFKFQQPTHIVSPVFNIIELFFKSLGPQNVRLNVENDSVDIEVKPILLTDISEEKYQYEINLMKNSIVEGTITERHNGILIDSGLESLTLHIPTDIKEQLKLSAEKEGSSLEEYATKLLKDGIMAR